jgi:hypothetical protein
MRPFAWLLAAGTLLLACSTGSDGALAEGDSHPAVDPNGDPAAGDGGSASADAPTPSTEPAPGPDECAPGDLCPSPAPSWSCAKSTYQGAQWWTCDGSTLYRCENDAPIGVACPFGCEVGPPGTHDTCRKTAPPPISIPSFKITISGGLFAESAVRKPIEDGLRYAIARIAKHVDVGSKKAPSFTINFLPSGNSYASGIADVDYTNVYVPYGYPLTGANQNYVVNITIHEIGHILAHALIAPRELRDTCVNEGLASWIAGKYWMNAASKAVSSHRDAARYDIARGAAHASMTTCNSASDAWYKVYASYFEYLEQKVPGGILAVSSAKIPKTAHTAAWSAWLQ